MNAYLESAFTKTKNRLIPLMLSLYILAFLDRSNIGFAKDAYQIDTGLSNEAYAFGAGIFFAAYAFLGMPSNILMKKFGARLWIGTTTLIWGALSAAMAFADTEFKFLLVRTLLGAAEAGFFPGMIYLVSQWFPQNRRASVMGLFYMGAPLALTFGSPLSGALLEMNGFAGHPGWFWMFLIEGLIAVIAGFVVFTYLDDNPATARFLNVDEKQALIENLTAEELTKSHSNFLDALKDVRIWHLGMIYMCIQIAVYGLIFFLPTQVANILGTKVGFMASLVTAIPWIAALIGTYTIPRYSDRTGERKFSSAVTLAVAGIGVAMSPLVSPIFAIIALCFAALGCFAVQPIYWTMPTRMLSGTALAAGIGFINMFGAVGGFLAPIIRVKAETMFASTSSGLILLGGVALIGTLLILALPMTKQYSTETTE